MHNVMYRPLSVIRLRASSRAHVSGTREQTGCRIVIQESTLMGCVAPPPRLRGGALEDLLDKARVIWFHSLCCQNNLSQFNSAMNLRPIGWNKVISPFSRSQGRLGQREKGAKEGGEVCSWCPQTRLWWLTHNARSQVGCWVDRYECVAWHGVRACVRACHTVRAVRSCGVVWCAR